MRVSKKDAAIQEKKAFIRETLHRIEDKECEGAEAEKERGRIEKKRQKERAKGDKTKALEDELGASVKELARLSTQAELMEGTISEEEKKAKTFEQALVDVSLLKEVKGVLQPADGPYSASYLLGVPEESSQ